MKKSKTGFTFGFGFVILVVILLAAHSVSVKEPVDNSFDTICCEEDDECWFSDYEGLLNL